MSNHEPIEEKYRKTMNKLAEGIDTVLNGGVTIEGLKRVGFVLMVYDLKDGASPNGGQFNYISNSERIDVMACMREILEKYDTKPSEETVQ